MERRCQCGAFQAQVEGDPIDQFHCHCSSCQADSGGAYISVATFPADAVTVSKGEPSIWNRNARCPTCGTHLFQEVPELGLRGVKANLFPQGVFQPPFHQWCEDAIHPIVDDLPHYRQFPAKFGGSDDTVDW